MDKEQLVLASSLASVGPIATSWIATPCRCLADVAPLLANQSTFSGTHTRFQTSVAIIFDHVAVITYEAR